MTTIVLDSALLSALVSDILTLTGVPMAHKSACLNRVAARLCGTRHNWGYVTGHAGPIVAPGAALPAAPQSDAPRHSGTPDCHPAVAQAAAAVYTHTAITPRTWMLVGKLLAEHPIPTGGTDVEAALDQALNAIRAYPAQPTGQAAADRSGSMGTGTPRLFLDDLCAAPAPKEAITAMLQDAQRARARATNPHGWHTTTDGAETMAQPTLLDEMPIPTSPIMPSPRHPGGTWQAGLLPTFDTSINDLLDHLDRQGDTHAVLLAYMHQERNAIQRSFEAATTIPRHWQELHRMLARDPRDIARNTQDASDAIRIWITTFLPPFAPQLHTLLQL